MVEQIFPFEPFPLENREIVLTVGVHKYYQNLCKVTSRFSGGKH